MLKIEVNFRYQNEEHVFTKKKRYSTAPKDLIGFQFLFLSCFFLEFTPWVLEH